MFNIDIDAKNNDGYTVRNLALFASHVEIAESFLVWEIDNYITCVRIRHMMRSGLKEMLPYRKR